MEKETTHDYQRTSNNTSRDIIFLIVLVSFLSVAHAYIINTPPSSSCTHTSSYDSSINQPGCVMDEVYYVPAALNMLQKGYCSLSVGNSCNPEHPFLSKALIALGIYFLGNNAIGWRLSIVISGIISIILFFILMRKLSSNTNFIYAATILFSTDTLFFVHSSIAVIDVPSIMFALGSFLAYFSKEKILRINKYLISGILIGFSILSKETGVFFLFFLIVYELIAGKDNIRKRFVNVVMLILPASLIFSGLTQLYNLIYVQGSPSFFSSIEYMVSYASGLKGGGWSGALFGNDIITPVDWFLFYRPVGYFVTSVSVNNLRYVSVGYYGITNMLIVWLLYAWIPIMFLRVSGKLTEQIKYSERDLKAVIFAFFWFVFCYLPYLFLWLTLDRVTYPFYAIQIVPALSIGASYFVTREWFPRKIMYLYLGASIGWFVFYFPVKDFLPVWIRVALSR